MLFNKQKRIEKKLKRIERKIQKLLDKNISYYNYSYFRTEKDESDYYPNAGAGSLTKAIFTKTQEWYYHPNTIQKRLEQMEKKHESPSLTKYNVQDLEKQKEFLAILKKQNITPREFIFPGADILTKNIGYIKKYLQDYFEKTYSSYEGFHQVNGELETILAKGNKRGDGMKLSTSKELSNFDWGGAFGFSLSGKASEILRDHKRELEKRNSNYDEFYNNFDAYLVNAKNNNMIDIYFTSVLAGYINKIEGMRSCMRPFYFRDLLIEEQIFKTSKEVDEFLENRFDPIWRYGIDEFGLISNVYIPGGTNAPFISDNKLAHSIFYLTDKTNDNWFFNDAQNSKYPNRTIFNLDTLKSRIENH